MLTSPVQEIFNPAGPVQEIFNPAGPGLGWERLVLTGLGVSGYSVGPSGAGLSVPVHF